MMILSNHKVDKIFSFNKLMLRYITVAKNQASDYLLHTFKGGYRKNISVNIEI